MCIRNAHIGRPGTIPAAPEQHRAGAVDARQIFQIPEGVCGRKFADLGLKRRQRLRQRYQRPAAGQEGDLPPSLHLRRIAAGRSMSAAAAAIALLDAQSVADARPRGRLFVEGHGRQRMALQPAGRQFDDEARLEAAYGKRRQRHAVSRAMQQSRQAKRKDRMPEAVARRNSGDFLELAAMPEDEAPAAPDPSSKTWHVGKGQDIGAVLVIAVVCDGMPISCSRAAHTRK